MSKAFWKIFMVIAFMILLITGSVYLYLQSLKKQQDVDLSIDSVSTPDTSTAKPDWLQTVEDWIKSGFITIKAHINIKNTSPVAMGLDNMAFRITDDTGGTIATTADNFQPPVTEVAENQTQQIPLDMKVLFSGASARTISNMILGKKSDVNVVFSYNIKGLPVSVKKKVTV